MKKTKTSNTTSDSISSVVPVRIPDQMQSSIRRLATREAISDADVMRMAIKRGLPLLEKLFANVDKAA